MPPSMQTDERRGIYYHQLPVVVQPRPKADSSAALRLANKRESLQKRKTILNELELRRKVKFSTIKMALLEDVPQASQMLDEEKDAIWWNREELEESMESIRRIMGSMAKRPRSKNGTQPHHSLLYRIENTCRVCSQEQIEPENSDDIKLLADWHRNTLSKRGLEKLILNNGEQNRKVVQTIVLASSMARDNAKIDERTKAESIRVCSERLTKPARLFAQALGEADAACAVTIPVRRRVVRRATKMLLQ